MLYSKRNVNEIMVKIGINRSWYASILNSQLSNTKSRSVKLALVTILWSYNLFQSAVHLASNIGHIYIINPIDDFIPSDHLGLISLKRICWRLFGHLKWKLCNSPTEKCSSVKILFWPGTGVDLAFTYVVVVRIWRLFVRFKSTDRKLIKL